MNTSTHEIINGSPALWLSNTPALWYFGTLALRYYGIGKIKSPYKTYIHIMTRLSRWLLILFGAPTAYFVYNLFSIIKSEYSFILVPLSMLIAITVVFRDQIDSWYLRRNKPTMDPQLDKILKAKVPSYDEIFSDRYEPADLLIFTFDCEFIGQGFESIPDDLKHIVNAHAFYFGKAEHIKWPSHYNRIVFYKHPFITPRLEEYAHSVEHHQDDGVIIFSLEQALPGIERNGKFFNVVLYGFAHAFLALYPLSKFSLTNEEIWIRLAHQLNANKDNIEGIIGLPEINPYAVVAHYFVYRREETRAAFPELEQSLFEVMNVG